MTPNISDMTGLIDLQAEQSVLGSILQKSDCIDDIRAIIEPRDFSQETHELIYRVMLYMADQDVPIDLVTVTSHFVKHNKVDQMGGVDYLAKLAGSTPTASNVVYYAKIMRSCGHRRRLRETGLKMISMAQQGEFEEDEELFTAAEDAVSDLRPQDTGKLRSFTEMKPRYYQHLKEKADKLKTGLFPQFDAWAQLWRGWLYILAGRPSVGKTAEALMLAYGIAQYNPGEGAVMIYSQEMGEEEVIDRIVSMAAEVNYPRLINKGGEEGFTKQELEKIDASYAILERLPIYISDAAGITIDQIRADAKRIKKRHGKIAAIIVDYLQIMEIPLRRGEKRHEGIGRVTKTAKNIARRMKLVFIMLSQLDRSVDDEEPKLRHLKESGSIEQDADVVQFLWWDGKEVDEKSKARIIHSIFAKGRNIGTNRFRLRFDWWIQKYKELEKSAGGEQTANAKRKNSK